MPRVGCHKSLDESNRMDARLAQCDTLPLRDTSLCRSGILAPAFSALLVAADVQSYLAVNWPDASEFQEGNPTSRTQSYAQACLATIQECVADLLDSASSTGLTESQLKGWVTGYAFQQHPGQILFSNHIRSGLNLLELDKWCLALSERPDDRMTVLAEGLLQRLSPAGLIALDLYRQIKEEKSNINSEFQEARRPVRGWYPLIIETAASAAKSVRNSFDALRSTIRNSELADRFFTAWERDALLPIHEAVGLAAVFCLANHPKAKSILEDKALDTPLLNRTNITDGLGTLTLWPQLQNSSQAILDAYPVQIKRFDRQLDRMLEPSAIHWLRLGAGLTSAAGTLSETLSAPTGPMIYPVPITIKDLLPFLGRLQDYWEEVNAIFKSGFVRIDNGYINFRDGDVLCRLNTGHGSFGRRIALIPKSQRYPEHKFICRVDVEEDESLSVDIGRLEVGPLLEFLRTRQSELAIPIEYGELVDRKGRLLPKPKRGKNEYPPHIFMPESNMEPGQKMGVMASCLSSFGASMMFRQGEAIANHYREEVATGFNFEDFHTVATELRRSAPNWHRRAA